MVGLLRFEPSDGGDLFFWPSQPVQMPLSTIEPYFRILTLIPVGQYSTFNVTKSIRTMDCAEARAEIVIHEVMVIGNDSEGAGAYPTRLSDQYDWPVEDVKIISQFLARAERIERVMKNG